MKDAPFPAQLHSRYNPQAEASRYIDALNLKSGIACFILIEPGLGYLVTELKKRCPDSKVIVLHADSRFREYPIPGAAVWYPDSGTTAQDFLEAEIPDASAAAARIIEWRPGLNLYADACLSLARDAADYIRRADAGRRTAAAFGKKWVKNFFRNLGLPRRALLFTQADCPVIVTGSGPGLEESLGEIRGLREGSILVAASSSLLALARAGLTPDLVISTDGGSWALTHLYSCFRPNLRGPLAASLCAALPSQCGDLPFLALNDGSLWQSTVLNALGIPSLVIPQRGTVTASAVDLALALSRGPVYLAGMDLSVRDIRTHARPYGFDHLFWGSATRLRPLYSQAFSRSTDMRQGGTHAIYAAWFKKQLASWPARVFPLGGNHEIFGAPAQTRNAPGSGADAAAKPPACAARLFTETPVHGAGAALRETGLRALIAGLENGRFGETLKKELGPLLFPGEQEVSSGGLAEALCAIAAGGKGRG
jgi:hypothetical protein